MAGSEDLGISRDAVRAAARVGLSEELLVNGALELLQLVDTARPATMESLARLLVRFRGDTNRAGNELLENGAPAVPDPDPEPVAAPMPRPTDSYGAMRRRARVAEGESGSWRGAESPLAAAAGPAPSAAPAAAPRAALPAGKMSAEHLMMRLRQCYRALETLDADAQPRGGARDPLRMQAEDILNDAFAHADKPVKAPRRGGGRRGGGGGGGGRPSKQCTVCYSDFEAAGDAAPFACSACGHAELCGKCFAQFVSHRARDEDVVPWVPCPTAECKVALEVSDLVRSSVSTRDLYALLVAFLYKMLARCEDWIECEGRQPRGGSKCHFGFLVRGQDYARHERKCEACGTQQAVQKKKPELDNEFKKMIAEGKLRPCPSCALLTLKEYGICNVIQCAKCGVWWNWRTRETGRDSHELKERARMAGALWEPGELHFQMDLQRRNPEEFRRLLERAGIRYDPNYVRGT